MQIQNGMGIRNYSTLFLCGNKKKYEYKNSSIHNKNMIKTNVFQNEIQCTERENICRRVEANFQCGHKVYNKQMKEREKCALFII